MLNNDIIKKLIHSAKMSLYWSKKHWDMTHGLDANEYPVPDINKAFNEWNWADRDLKEAISMVEAEMEKEQKEKDELFLFDKNNVKKTTEEIMCEDDKKEFTRLTHESSYGVKTTIEFDSEDVSAEDYIQAMVTIMTSATFTPTTILRSMYDYAHDALKAHDPGYLNEE